MQRIIFSIFIILFLCITGYAQTIENDETMYSYKVSCDDNEVVKQVMNEIDAILKKNNYVITNEEKADYKIHIVITFDYQQFQGTLPTIRIPKISVFCYNSEDEEVCKFDEIYGEKVKISSKYLLSNVNEFETLQNNLFTETIKKLRDIKFPKRFTIEKPIQTQPAKETDNKTELIDPNDITNLQTQNEKIEEQPQYVLSISAGFAFSKLVTSDGLGEGTANTSLIGVNLEFSIDNLIPLLLPKFTFDGVLINEAAEKRISRSNQLSGTMYDIGFLCEVNLMQFLDIHNSLENEYKYEIFSGLGFRTSIISLKRTDVKIGEFSFPDEETSSSIFGVYLPVRMEFCKIFNSDFNLGILVEISMLFGNELTGSFKFRVTIEYPLSKSSSLFFSTTLNYCEFSISEEESISQDYQRIYLGYIIKF